MSRLERKVQECTANYNDAKKGWAMNPTPETYQRMEWCLSVLIRAENRLSQFNLIRGQMRRREARVRSDQIRDQLKRGANK